MSTQQQLTTEQAEVLITLSLLEKFEDEGDISMSEKIDRFSWDCIGVDGDEVDELLETIEYYGYINSESCLTIDGKQYIALLSEHLDKKSENPSIVINNQFTLINIEKLNAGINAVIESVGICDTIKGVKNAVQNVIRTIKGKK